MCEPFILVRSRQFFLIKEHLYEEHVNSIRMFQGSEQGHRKIAYGAPLQECTDPLHCLLCP